MLKSFIHGCGLLALMAGTLVQAASSGEKISSLKDQQEVAVTIYNENLALVKDQRRVALDRGENHLAWRDVSARIMPETALLRSLGGGDGVSAAGAEFRFRSAYAAEAAGQICRPERHGHQDQPRYRGGKQRGRHGPEHQQRRGAEIRRPHRNRHAGAYCLQSRAGKPARPPDAGDFAAQPCRGRAANGIELPHRRLVVARRLCRGTEPQGRSASISTAG